MFNSGSDGFTMPVVPQCYGNNGGLFGGDGYGGGWFWIIIILLFAGYGWGNGNGWGNGSGSVMDSYVLNSDFSTLSRQIDSGFSNTNGLIINSADQLQRQVTSVADGICSLGYDQLGQMNNINNTVTSTGQNILNAINNSSINAMQDTNALTAQLTSCCCDNRAATKDLQYALATQSCATDNLISTSFGNLRYDMAAQDCAIKQTVNDVGRNLADVQNANTQAVLAAIQSIKDDAKDEKIASLQSQLSDARLIANNNAQTAIFTDAINDAVSKLTPPTPIPAFSVNPPFVYSGCGCSSCGC